MMVNDCRHTPDKDYCAECEEAEKDASHCLGLQRKVRELEAALAKRNEEALAAEGEIRECLEFVKAGAAHPMVAERMEEHFNRHGPVVFLEIAAQTIKAQQEEIDALLEARR